MDSARTEVEALLAPYLHSSGPRYQRAPWLLSDFTSNVWHTTFGRQLTIDWRVMMYDGQLLTGSRHLNLCNALRSFLVLQTHLDTTGGKLHTKDGDRAAIQRAIVVIDFLLLHQQRLELATHGLAALTTGDLRLVIAAIGSNRALSIGVYEWPRRLAMYLREQIELTPGCVLQRLVDENPMLAESIPDQSLHLLDLDATEIALARSWIHSQAGYRIPPPSSEYALVPRVRTLSAQIYTRTIWGHRGRHPIPPELCLVPGARFETELPRARVHSLRDERMDSRYLSQYVGTLSTLQLLRREGFDVPDANFSTLRDSLAALDLKPAGRFRTLPYPVVFDALRKALEFSLEFGSDVLSSYVAIASEASARGVAVSTFAAMTDIKRLLVGRTADLGVVGWSIEPINAGCNHGPASLSRTAYFKALRRNEGLYECIRVLYGATQVIVGALMARRQGELQDLEAGSCLDTSRTRLVFANRKSGLLGLRELEARPIPAVAVRMIDLLERFQLELAEKALIPTTTRLFTVPRRVEVGLVSLESATYNVSLDYFCDWAETGVDRDGHRFYLRQHPLRRFFAMLFFFGGGFGTLDTLRWFLGHTDPAHLWHYITESTPGAVIQSVAAEWATYGVKHATEEAAILGTELKVHFGTDDFSVLPDDALQSYLEELMEQGRLRIEPQFLDGGTQYRIAVVLSPHGDNS